MAEHLLAANCAMQAPGHSVHVDTPSDLQLSRNESLVLLADFHEHLLPALHASRSV